MANSKDISLAPRNRETAELEMETRGRNEFQFPIAVGAAIAILSILAWP